MSWLIPTRRAYEAAMSKPPADDAPPLVPLPDDYRAVRGMIAPSTQQMNELLDRLRARCAVALPSKDAP